MTDGHLNFIHLFLGASKSAEESEYKNKRWIPSYSIHEIKKLLLAVGAEL